MSVNLKLHITLPKMYTKVKQEKMKANESYILNSQNKCKAAWNIIRNESISTGKNNETQENVINSNTFNEYFINAPYQINNSKVPDNFYPAIDSLGKFINSCDIVNSSFKWKEITISDILKSVNKLSTSKSEDYYGFSNKVIKEVIDLLAQPLVYIFNFSIKNGVFPSALKITKTVPIFKKGNRLCPSSYRPIALVPIFSKVFEHCIKEQAFQ